MKCPVVMNAGRQSQLRRSAARVSLTCCLTLSLVAAYSVAIGQNGQSDSSEIAAVQQGQSIDIATQRDPADKARSATAFVKRPQDEERPDEQFTLQLFNRPLTIGGELETELRYREDISLGRRDDDDTRVTQGLQLDLLYHLTSESTFYVKIETSYQADLDTEDNDTESSRKVELGELWLAVGGLGSDRLGLQIGRQNFGDEREWWWDEQLDAVRLHYTEGIFSFQLAIGVNPTSFFIDNDDVAPEDEDTTWLIASANWEWTRKNHFEAFFLSRFDHSPTPEEGDIVPRELDDEEDGAINWLGLRSIGRFKIGDLGRIHYWLDSGMVYGRETLIDFNDTADNQREVDERFERTINGWGLDIGATWATKLPLQPRLTFGYAIGSGDANPDNGMNRAYRQSGLQSNDDKFRGANSFRYYGEFLRPELSNLSITTLALGFPVWEESSVELVYHRYTQIYATDRLRNSRLRTDPEGEHRDIGEEFNIILGLEEWQQLEIELIATLFRSGKAYGTFANQTASSVTVEVEYNF